MFPPWCLFERDGRAWERVTSEDEKAFVLCHNDLLNRNIFIHPESNEIKYIIDWECAGYFPKQFEIPLLKQPHGDRGKIYDEVRDGDLKLWGLTREDLRDTLADEVDCLLSSADGENMNHSKVY